jgi:hypothetical protein
MIVETENAVELHLFDRPEWNEGFPCPVPMCGGRMMKADPSAFRAQVPSIVMKAPEFYRRISGQGEAAYIRVHNLLLTKRIVAVDGEPVGEPERTVIKCLTLEDGTKLHFGISRYGACAYKLEEPFDATETDPEGNDSDRKEAGRVVETFDNSKGRGSKYSLSVADSAESAGAGAVSVVPTAGGVPRSDVEGRND